MIEDNPNAKQMHAKDYLILTVLNNQQFVTNREIRHFLARLGYTKNSSVIGLKMRRMRDRGLVKWIEERDDQVGFFFRYSITDKGLAALDRLFNNLDQGF